MNSTHQLSFGKMCRESSTRPTTPSAASLRGLWERLPPSFRQTDSDGQTRVWLLDPNEAQPGEFSILNISAWPNDASVCSLSQVLEKNCPRKYFLSSRACAGILRRAEKRGKVLPMQLEAALRAVANGGMICHPPYQPATEAQSEPENHAGKTA